MMYTVYRRLGENSHVVIGEVEANSRDHACMQFREGEHQNAFLTAIKKPTT